MKSKAKLLKNLEASSNSDPHVRSVPYIAKNYQNSPADDTFTSTTKVYEHHIMITYDQLYELKYKDTKHALIPENKKTNTNLTIGKFPTLRRLINSISPGSRKRNEIKRDLSLKLPTNPKNKQASSIPNSVYSIKRELSLRSVSK